MSFWNQFKPPFFVMAPMKDVTDPAFRQLVAKCGAPDVFWTEFVAADGLYHTREIQKMSDSENPLMRDLAFGANECPIVAQIFSSKPSMIAYAAKLATDLGFDGVDINMGCPDRNVEKQGAGAAIIKNPQLAVELIRAAQEASGLPVSVKTRIGYNTDSLEEWLPVLLSANPAAITIHLRTRKELSLVPADWSRMKKAVEIRNRINPEVLLIGNGDLRDREDAEAKIAESGCDGAMLGRAMFGNPWVFAGKKISHPVGYPDAGNTPLAEKLAALLELAYAFEKLSPPKSFAILKKHIKAFVTGFDGAAEFRAKLMEANSAADLERILHENADRSST